MKIYQFFLNYTFDQSDLRSRRLMYIGHVLRMDPEHMTRRVIVARGTDHRDGDLFMDCPDHDSIETLTEIAYDRKLRMDQSDRAPKPMMPQGDLA